MVRALIFDAEGVVIDTETIWDRAQEELLRRLGHRYDRETVKPLLTGRSSLEGAGVLRELYHLEDSAEALSLKRRQLVVSQLRQDVGFIPGCLEFLDRVRDRYQTALATAMDPDLLQLVDERLGLRRLFGDRVFTLENVSHRSKPAPDLFLHAAGALGVDPSRCLVIEDSPHGIEAARRAGMRCVALTTTYSAPHLGGADQVVSSFSEIDLPG